MKHKITRTKIKRIHFYEICQKKREIQYYATIRMEGFCPTHAKSEGVLSEGVLPEGVLSGGLCPEGVLSAHR